MAQQDDQAVRTTGEDAESGVSRRRMLGFGGAAAGLGLAAVVMRADSASALTNSSFLYNVKDAPYLATGNGVTDDTASINSALAAAGAAGGGIVYLPPGTYRITGALVVPGAVWLQGVGFIPREGAVPLGSVLFGASPAASMVRLDGKGSHLSDVALYQTQNLTTPTVYPPAISVTGNDATIERVFLYNVYDGIFLTPGLGLGRLMVQQVVGQPLHYGIRVNGATDTVYVNDIHFWPYAGNSPFAQANGIGILSERNDNPFFSNIFCLGYKIGMKLTSSATGITAKMRMSNADMDGCDTGLLVESGCTAMVTNYTQAVGSTGIIVQSNATLQVTSCRISSVSGNGIRVGSGAQCYIDNVIIEGWNGSGLGFPGIENVGGGAFAVIVGRCRAFGPGNGAPAIGPGITLDN